MKKKLKTFQVQLKNQYGLLLSFPFSSKAYYQIRSNQDRKDRKDRKGRKDRKAYDQEG